MRYGQIKRWVLELIHQYSIAGETISPAYNNQSDDIHRIPGFINHALIEICTGPVTVKAVENISCPEGESPDEWKSFSLPAGFRRLRTVLEMFPGYPPRQSGRYRLVGNSTIWLPPGEFSIEYDSYPDTLPSDPADTYDLTVSPEIISAACFYAAAELVRMDSRFDYAALQNEYEARIARLKEPVYSEMRSISDVYGFHNGEMF